MKKLGKWDYENLFYQTSDVSRLRKIIDHYEIYKMSLKAKGDILEFGVFKGVSLIRFLTFRDIINKKNIKHVYGFDAFGKFPLPNQKNLHKKRDTFFAKFHDKIGKGIKEQNLQKLLKKKNFKKFTLIKGDINSTLDKFLIKKKKIKISLLHLDLDIYEPTKKVLETLYKHVAKKGIILFDDYKHIKGATVAIDEFMKKNPNLKIKKLSKKSRPSFIVNDI